MMNPLVIHMDSDSSDFHDSDAEEEQRKETERIADTLGEINCKNYTDAELEEYVNELRSLAHQCVEKNSVRVSNDLKQNIITIGTLTFL